MPINPGEITWDDEPRASDVQPDPATVTWDAVQPSSSQPPPLGHVFGSDGRVILEDQGSGAAVGGDTGIIGEDGGSHTEDNPALAGANTAVNAMLKSGAPKKDIIAYLQGRGGWTDADLLSISGQIDAIHDFQKKNPKYKGDFNVDLERKQVGNSAFQNFANSDIGTGLASAGDAALGFSGDNLIGSLGGDAEQARAKLALAQAAHPASSTVGTIAGGVGGALGAEEALGAAGLKGLPKVVGADLLYGSAAGAGSTDYAADGTPATAADRLGGAGEGAAAALVGSAVGQGAARAGQAFARSAKDPYVATINAEGIPTTVGQQYSGKIGGIIKRTEDRIAGLPLIGDTINARRVEGIKKFNATAFDRALAPIGVKSEGKIAEEGVDYAQDKISDAFEAALKGKAVAPDSTFAQDLTKAVRGVQSIPRVGNEVGDSVRAILEPYMQPGTSAISGEAMQQISRELRDLKASYYNDPLKHRIGKEIDSVENAIFGPFKRQAPEVLPAYTRAKVAQSRLYVLADAVNKAKNQDGIFMPSQLGQADRAATIKTQGKVGAARGRGQFHDLQRAAQAVLPSKIPDSGTAGRLLIPGAALGVGGISDEAGVTHGLGLTLAGILTLAYSRTGQRLLTKPGRGIAGSVGNVLKSDKTRRALTTGGAATGVALSSQ